MYSAFFTFMFIFIIAIEQMILLPTWVASIVIISHLLFSYAIAGRIVDMTS